MLFRGSGWGRGRGKRRRLVREQGKPPPYIFSPTHRPPPPVCHVELVVAHFRENLDWLKDLASRQDICLRVYNKDVPPASTPKGFQASEEVRLPNVFHGREAHTYLYHIITKYDDLPEWTVFLQGQPFEHFPKITEFLLGYEFNRTNASLQCLTCQYTPHLPNFGCKERMEPRVFGIDPVSFEVVSPQSFIDRGVQDFMGIESRDLGVARENISSDFCRKVGLPPPQGPIDFCYAAQFIVHRDRIQQHPRELYERMFAYLMRPNGLGHGSLNVSCTECRAHEVGGYIIERLWFYIFRGNATTGSA